MIVKLEATQYFDFITSNPNTGAAQDADSTPSCEIFEDATDTTVYALAATVKRTAKTGNYRQQVDFTAANGFEAGKSYNLVASATVTTVAAKAVISTIRVTTRNIDDVAFPATSGRSLLVDTAGGISLTTPQGIKKNTALANFVFWMFDTTGAPKTALSGFTAKRKLDAGALGDLTNAASIAEIDATNFPGAYVLDLVAGDVNGDLVSFRFAASGARDTALTFKTVTA